MIQRWITVLLFGTILAAASGTLAQGGNLLQDPGFEGEYTNRGRADLNVPAPWGLWVTNSPRSQEWQNLDPVAFPHPGPGPNPHGGARAFNFNRGFATFTAAIYQQVSVPEGSNVTASAWAHLRTCNIPEGFDNCGSAVESGAYTRIGIDPNGGTNPYDSDIVWSPSAAPHDRWDQLTVSATATGSTVTLFLFTTQEWPSELNNVYWDDASLSIGGAGGAAAAPAADAQGTPAATVPPPPPAQVGFVIAQTPQPDGSIIHTIQPGDTIDSIAVAYGLTRAELLALNPLANPRIIQIGQQLTVRTPTGDAETTAEVQSASTRSSTQAASAPTSAPQSEGPLIYYVQPGDTVDSIAFANGLTRDELMALNNMTDPRIIQIGQQLILRGAPESSVESASAESETAAEATSEVSGEVSDEVVPEAESTPEATEEPATPALMPEDLPPAPIVSVESGAVLPPLNPAADAASVCVFLFEDANQNRLQEVGEDLLEGGTITLLLDGSAVDEYTPDGQREPHCFDELEAGDYTASAVAPEGYGLTTAAQLHVRALSGTEVTLAFGAAQGVEVAMLPPDTEAGLATDEPGDQPATGTTPDANPLTDNLGLIVFGAAGVVLVVGMGASLALRRR